NRREAAHPLCNEPLPANEGGSIPLFCFHCRGIWLPLIPSNRIDARRLQPESSIPSAARRRRAARRSRPAARCGGGPALALPVSAPPAGRRMRRRARARIHELAVRETPLERTAESLRAPAVGLDPDPGPAGCYVPLREAGCQSREHRRVTRRT